MVGSGRVGVGKVALREREHLALIRPLRHGLVLETMAFPDEVQAIEEAVPPVEVTLDPRELDMAHLLVGSMTLAIVVFSGAPPVPFIYFKF